MRKLKRVLFIFIGIAVILGVIIISCASPIAKYLVEKYDEKYTGRQIVMDWAYVNPFTGYIYFNNLKIYELKSDTVFISTNSISATISMLKLFSKTYEISELTVDNPHIIIIQNKKNLNFSDLIEKFSPKEDSTISTKKEPVHFSILNIKINEGEFYYHEKVTPVNYFIKNVNVESTGIQWNADTIAANISLLPGIGKGDVKGDFTINTKTLDYRYAAVVHKLDLNIIEQYLKELTNYGSFSANLDADIKSTGNFKDEEDVTTKGTLAINDFHFGKNPKEDYASFDKLIVNMIDISPKKYKYYFDSVLLSHPYFKYELYDRLDNIQTMFGKGGSNVKAVKGNPEKFNLVIEIADYIKVLSKNFFESNYKINRLRISNGDIKYNDFSVSEKFSVDLNPLNIKADSIDKNNKRANMLFTSGIKPYGNVSISLSINPKDEGDFDMHYHFQKLSVAMFNPYTISYTSFPLDRGTIDLNGEWNARKGILKSNNHLVIIDPRTTKRLRKKDAKWIPVPLIMFFVRDRGNVIDYEIPISGNFKNPKFHLCNAIIGVLENIFIKPPTTPYRMLVENVETEIEKSITLKWDMRTDLLQPTQERFIEMIANFLKKNPEASISVYPNIYSIKEKEYILLFEAKKKYFLLTNHKDISSFNEADAKMVDKMSSKDSLFVRYLNKQVKGAMLFTIQDKCSRLVDSSVVNAKFKQLNNERIQNFMLCFKRKEVDKRVKIYSEENVVPYNGFSFYKIKYNEKFPESLIHAYQRMNELNEKAPRKKFLKERMKNKNRW